MTIRKNATTLENALPYRANKPIAFIPNAMPWTICFLAFQAVSYGNDIQMTRNDTFSAKKT
jgi:hypothetical protein